MFLSSFALRLIALITMTVDHVGHFLYPRILWLRIVGRLAFPLFLFLCNEAYKYTRDRRKYALRLLIMGLGMHAVMLVASGPDNANIFITLAVCFITVWSLDEKQYLIAALAIAGGMALSMDYGLYAVGLMLVFHYLDGRWYLIAPLWVGLNAMGVALWHHHVIQHFSIISLLFIVLYNHKPGEKRFKYLFYLYYPLHIAVLYLLSGGLS